MGWVNTMLDIGIIGMQASQKNKLEQLQRQNAEAALIQAVLQALRDEIFRYKQAADEVLALESNNPKVAAAGMKILYLRLEDFGITTDMFPDISDKEYVAATTKSIRDNAKRLEGSLSLEDQAEVNAVADAAMNLPGYNYYIQHHEVVQAYRQSLPTYNELKTRNNGCVAIGVIFGSLMFLPMIFLGIGTVCGGLISNDFGSTLGCLGVLTGFVASLAVIILFLNKVQRSGEYGKAKQQIAKVEKENIDLPLYAQLEEKYGYDYEQVVSQRDEATKLVNSFFKDSDLTYQLSG